MNLQTRGRSVSIDLERGRACKTDIDAGGTSAYDETGGTSASEDEFWSGSDTEWCEQVNTTAAALQAEVPATADWSSMSETELETYMNRLYCFEPTSPPEDDEVVAQQQLADASRALGERDEEKAALEEVIEKLRVEVQNLAVAAAIAQGRLDGGKIDADEAPLMAASAAQQQLAQASKALGDRDIVKAALEAEVEHLKAKVQNLSVSATMSVPQSQSTSPVRSPSHLELDITSIVGHPELQKQEAKVTDAAATPEKVAAEGAAAAAEAAAEEATAAAEEAAAAAAKAAALAVAAAVAEEAAAAAQKVASAASRNSVAEALAELPELTASQFKQVLHQRLLLCADWIGVQTKELWQLLDPLDIGEVPVEALQKGSQGVLGDLSALGTKPLSKEAFVLLLKNHIAIASANELLRDSIGR